ncbi:hypothetical protein AWB68_02405 [Caballeronia choica]|jgi:hypothetical protein|uniref:Uncharacterized protein n=1 Tax=Caballeronia choica TaxID=326476 RepID=A0A158HWW5_9BURK|nr:hypothetical protein [Caballeronia choica]SAL48818.1 hypothetical protein AWB68_02405 [Caballeronia choica]
MLAVHERDDMRFHGRLPGAERGPTARKVTRIRWVNHELEADAAGSLWRLAVRLGFDDVQARRVALKHAGMAGWGFAGLDSGVRSPLFKASTESDQAFEMGRTLFFALDHLLTARREEEICR